MGFSYYAKLKNSFTVCLATDGNARIFREAPVSTLHLANQYTLKIAGN